MFSHPAPYDFISRMRRMCPVPGCGITTLRMKRHWQEKHTEIVESLHCALCDFITKRKSNLVKHIKVRHGLADPERGVGKVLYHTNAQYMDPSPYSLEDALK